METPSRNSISIAAHPIDDHRSDRHLAELTKYFLGAAAALVADASTLYLLSRLQVPMPVAVALAFLTGLTVIYNWSIRFAFQNRTIEDPKKEFLVFGAIGLAGLLLTELGMWLLVGALSTPLLPAKFMTAACVFIFNFALRKKLLFSTP